MCSSFENSSTAAVYKGGRFSHEVPLAQTISQIGNLRRVLTGYHYLEIEDDDQFTIRTDLVEEWDWSFVNSTSSVQDVYLVRKDVFDCSGDGAVTAFPLVSSLMSEDFDKAMSGINQAVGHIGFTEMFRTTEHQRELKKAADERLKNCEKSWNPLENKPLPAAEPGTSSHEAGFSFDISAVILDGTRGKQIIEILNKSGFYQDVQGDRPHFTYNVWSILSDEAKQNAVKVMQANAAKLGLPSTTGPTSDELRRKKARENSQCK